MSIELELTLRVALMLGFVLISVLVLIWLERKFIGHIQMRLGPMRTGYHGVFQSPADAVKLLVKEDLIPASADKWVFQLAPFAVFVPIFLVFVALPFTGELLIRNLDLGLFYIVAVSSFSIVGLLMAGWASSNKYALLGGVRAAAQMISYELPLVISILGVAMLTRSLSLNTIVQEQTPVPFIVLQPLGFGLFLTASLAELARSPFDIPVAESEVVGGPFVEYSGIRWAFFFLGEYANLFAIAAICAIVYLGGWSWPYLPPSDWLGGWGERLIGAGLFLAKTYAIVLLIFWLRATLPRFRIDQLMSFAWKVLIPLAFLNVILTGIYLMYGWATLIISLIVSLGLLYLVYRGQGRVL